MTKDDLDISKQPFARKPETEAEAEARRAKHKPVDMSGSLKVVEPLNTKITAAIAKDFIDKGRKAQKAADAVIAAVSAKAPKRLGGPWALDPKILAAERKAIKPKKTATKKLSGPLAKALRDRDALNAKVAEAKSAKSTGSAKPANKKSAEPRRSNGKYDWDKAEADAKSGKLPALPPFGSYRSHIFAFYELAKKKDLAGIEKQAKTYVDHVGARANMFRFVGLLKTALRK
jgi:hypothetical protein